MGRNFRLIKEEVVFQFSRMSVSLSNTPLSEFLLLDFYFSTNLPQLSVFFFFSVVFGVAADYSDCVSTIYQTQRGSKFFPHFTKPNFSSNYNIENILKVTKKTIEKNSTGIQNSSGDFQPKTVFIQK